MSDRLLIVNADDYGLTEGVSAAILDAHRHGVVTSTSALALGSGFARSAPWLAGAERLGVGVHLAAVGEDPPLLSAREVPTLVDRKGRLDPSWRRFLPRCAAGHVDAADLRREFAAQVEAVRGHGVRPTHLDSHQNLHLWPLVRDVLFELGEREGIRVVRVTRSAAAGAVGRVVRRLAADLERRCDERGWAYARASTGLDEAGALAEPAMLAALDRLGATAAPTAELATHPGGGADPDLARYRWGYRWHDEYAALCAPAVRERVRRHGFRLGSFADLVAVG
jgi:chitin disaccharide deacetylase